MHLTNPTAPFDALAETYDEELPGTRLLRRRIRKHITPCLKNCRHLLELGCGTGEDALDFAENNINVTATDSSTAMLNQVTTKARKANLENRIEPRKLDMNDPPAPQDLLADLQHTNGAGVPEAYDVAFSNFGALNCVHDLPRLSDFLRRVLAPGGRFIGVVINRCCPAEILYHLCHFQPRQAFRRFRDGEATHIGKGETIHVWYPTPKTFAGQFEPEFTPKATFGIGILLPPPYLTHKIEHRTKLTEFLYRGETRIASWYPATMLSDLYLMVLQRNNQPDTPQRRYGTTP